jgi:quercetin dioxygenase-like cupin family protein
MIFRNQDAIAVNVLQGLKRKTLAQSQSMMICEFTFDANVTIPIHNHLHDQVGYVVEGRVIMTIAGQETELVKGDSYCASSNVPHGAYTLEPTVIIDTFSPPREDYR